MKFIRIRMALALALCSFWCSVNAAITFANQKSGFSVADDARLNLAGATLSSGSIRVSEGGEFYTSASADEAGVPITCTGTAIEILKDGALANSMVVDGRVTLTGTSPHQIVIGNDAAVERLIIEEGSPLYAISVEGGTETFPAIIEGNGRLSVYCYIAGGKYLHLRWNGILRDSIVATSDNPHVVLEQDLVLAPDFTFDALNFSHTTHLDCSGNTLWLSGFIASQQSWNNANVIQLNKVVFQDDVAVAFASDGIVDGQNNSISFAANSILNRDGNVVTLKNICLESNGATTILDSSDTGGSWLLNNVQIQDDSISGLLTIDGSITNQHPNITGGTAVWGADTILTLNKSLSTSLAWSFAGAGTLNGSGTTFDMENAAITFGGNLAITDITLANIKNSSFVNTGGTGRLFLSDVIWNDWNNNGLRITGINDATAGASVALAATNSGNLFETNVTFSDAQIDLLSDSVLAGTWTIQGDVVLNGNGHTLTMLNGTFNIASGATLHLRNVLLDQVVTASLANTTTSSLDLSNVTMILGDSDVAWGAYHTTITVNGRLYVVTGTHTITMPYTHDTTTGTTILNGVTAYYDTLSATDGANLQGCTGTGRVLFINPVYSGQDSISGALAYLETNEYLVVGNAFTSPRTLVFTSGGQTQYEGSGQTINFSSLPESVITVQTDTTVTTTNMVLNGLLPQHFDGAGTLLFGNGTTIKLQQDWLLKKELKFGTATDVAEEMVIDCNGYLIDMSNVAAKLSLNSSSAHVKTLRLCNGRLTKLSGTKLLIGNGSKVILENMELVINNDTNDYSLVNDADVVVQGTCSVSGNAGRTFINSSTGDVRILSGSTLTIGDGITWYHNNNGTTNLIFADATSRLELIGATLKRKSFADEEYTDKLLLTVGTMIVDHASIIDLGDTGIAFGTSDSEDNFELVFRPSASLHVQGAGALIYDNTL